MFSSISNTSKLEEYKVRNELLSLSLSLFQRPPKERKRDATLSPGV